MPMYSSLLLLGADFCLCTWQNKKQQHPLVPQDTNDIVYSISSTPMWMDSNCKMWFKECLKFLVHRLLSGSEQIWNKDKKRIQEVERGERIWNRYSSSVEPIILLPPEYKCIYRSLKSFSPIHTEKGQILKSDILKQRLRKHTECTHCTWFVITGTVWLDLCPTHLGVPRRHPRELLQHYWNKEKMVARRQFAEIALGFPENKKHTHKKNLWIWKKRL